MKRDPDFSYINKNGKRVSGSAAFLHHVYSVNDGVANYNDEIGSAYIAEFVKQNSDIINTNIEKKARKKRFKVV